MNIKSSEVYVQADNALLFCRVMGRGDPLIVVHGGPGLSMDYLLPSLEELASDHLVIFYDQRGNGKSTGEINDENINLDKFIDDLRAIQNHFKFKKIGLVGHSWGAYLAMSYATEYTDQVNKLIILNSIPISYSENLSGAELTKKDPYEEMIDNILTSEAYKHQNKEGMLKHYKDLFQFFFYNPRLVDKLNLDNLTATQVQKSALIHKIFEDNFYHKPHDLSEKLAKLSGIPTLIIHGDNHDIPIFVAQKIHSLIKGSVLTILESGHFPYLEKPVEFFKGLREFSQLNTC